jgi:hypothetical protein
MLMTSAAACASPIICSGPAGATPTSASDLEKERRERRGRRSEKNLKRKIAHEQAKAKAKVKAKTKKSSSARYHLTYLKLKIVSKLS